MNLKNYKNMMIKLKTNCNPHIVVSKTKNRKVMSTGISLNNINILENLCAYFQLTLNINEFSYKIFKSI